MNNSNLFPMAIVAFCMYVFLPSTFAQIEVRNDGRVAVGTSTVSDAQLNVNTSSFGSGLYLTNSKNTSSSKYGIRNNVFSGGTGAKYGINNFVQQNSSASGSNHAYGLYTRMYGHGSSKAYGIYNQTRHSASGYRYGLYNEVLNQGTGRAYGIYNKVQCNNSTSNTGLYNYVTSSGNGNVLAGLYSFTPQSAGPAAFLNGDVVIWGTLTNPSDITTKENIKGITNALSLIGQLTPKMYNYKKIENLNLPEGEQYGFIAQELEKVFPTLVKDVKVGGLTPEEMEEETMKMKQLKTVNYTGLTPILVKAVQEQQNLIKQQQQLIEQLSQRLERLEQQ